MRRYEIKYVLEPRDVYKLEELLMSHSASFSKSYPNRIVQNIYFDTVDFRAAQSNLGGISDRTKIRYRWYGQDMIPKTGTIEQKIKLNNLGFKKLKQNINYKSIDQLTQLINSSFPSYHLQPTIYNRYSRQYFEDFSKAFRLTVDSGIKYKYPEPGFESTDSYIFEDDRVVVELKFDEQHYRLAENITQGLPFRQNKHSKYVAGVFGLYT